MRRTSLTRVTVLCVPPFLLRVVIELSIAGPGGHLATSKTFVDSIDESGCGHVSDRSDLHGANDRADGGAGGRL